MRIHAFVMHYPSAYKPYYDNQFADLIRKGHDLRIFAVGSIDEVVSRKVVEHALDRRTRYIYPDDLRSLPRFLPALCAELARHPVRRWAAARRVGRRAGSLKRGIKDVARLLTLPDDPPDLCLVNGHLTMALVPWLRELHPGVPVALIYYGGEPREAGPADEAATRAAFAGADVVFCLTEYARREAIGRGCDPGITAVLPIGFDLDDYRPPADRTYRPHGVLRLLSVSRLSEGKGHGYALEALRSLIASGLRALRYTIIGDGYMRPVLERYIEEHGLAGHVEFLGTRSNPDVIAALGEHDVLVLPSVTKGTWTETQAAVVQEACLMKALVVTTTTGGVPESIPEAMKPFAAPPNDPAALAAAIERVCRLSPAELRALGEEARRWAMGRYDIRELNERMLRTVRERTGRPGKQEASAAVRAGATARAAPGAPGRPGP